MALNPPTEDIKDLLEDDAGLELEFGTNLFIGKEPDKPIESTTLFDTPGGKPNAYYDGGIWNLNPRLQVRVRSASYLTGWDLLHRIRMVLHNRTQVEATGSVYIVIRCTQEPALLDWDEKGWCRFVSTFEMVRELVGD